MNAVVLTARRCLLAAAAISIIAGSACSESPTSPDPVPTANSGPPPTAPSPTTPSPTPVGSLQIEINPNPVPHSGVPITDAAGCANVQFTWYYDQIIRETGGSTVTLTSRIDLFDDRETNNRTNLNVVVPANGSTTIRSRWCSSNRAAHSAQTRWTGTDANGRTVTVLGPRVTLNMP
jgi:hypothetical protein